MVVANNDNEINKKKNAGKLMTILLLATIISSRPCYGQYKINYRTKMFISMLLTYSYNMGAHRR